jgi:mono/diheme cytochrome c family protein
MVRTLLSSIFAIIAFGSAHAQDMQSYDRVERGRYLAVLGDCAACHTSPGGRPFAGGLPLETPFGVIVTANITPDAATGIGNMSQAEFAAALHEGRGLGGKRLYPAMPYPAYTKLTDQDVSDLRSYFATIARVNNKVISNQLPFPMNVRTAMMFWNGLNFTPGRFQPNNEKSAEWNRGAYIVQGPGHCGTCHTPKSILGAEQTSKALQGSPLQGWFAPNITANTRKGIGGWSKDEIAQYLKTGTNTWTLASGPMADAVTHSTSMMKDDDIAAIATYLMDNGDGNDASKPTSIAADDKAMKAGAAIFKDSCAACHKDSGMGEAYLFPRLAGSALVQSDDPTTLARIVLQGSRAVATNARPTGPAMPAFDWRLNDAQVAALLTYIRNSWGNAASAVSSADVASQRSAHIKTIGQN